MKKVIIATVLILSILFTACGASESHSTKVLESGTIIPGQNSEEVTVDYSDSPLIGRWEWMNVLEDGSVEPFEGKFKMHYIFTSDGTFTEARFHNELDGWEEKTGTYELKDDGVVHIGYPLLENCYYEVEDDILRLSHYYGQDLNTYTYQLVPEN